MTPKDALQIFDGRKVRTLWNDDAEKWYFSIVDVVGILTDSVDGRKYWNKLKQRLKEEGNESVTNCHQLKMQSTDGKRYLTDVADTEQLFRLIQSIPSPKAEPFKQWMASVASERLDQMQDPELSIEQAMTDYKRLGYSDNWINQRLKSIEIRKELTDEWKRHGLEEGVQFATLTDIITKTWSGHSTKEYKGIKGLKNENLCDNMTNRELVMNMLAELSTKDISEIQNPKTISDHADVARRGGNVAKKARLELEKKNWTKSSYITQLQNCTKSEKIMQLQTPVEIPNSTFKITSHSKGLIVGSCFAERIAERLSQFRFTIQTNPHGIIYNPASILQTLQALQANTKYTQADLIQHSGLYHSPAHHGSFSTPTASQTLQNINSVKLENQPDYIIITLGTAWIYKLNGTVVANCHKLPESNFTRNRLTFSEIADSLTQIAELFPLAHKIFTVSPIRHIKDGLTENSHSKALLRSAIGQTVDSHNDCSYFPAYEIMMDELRDYRFYAPDMTHPTAQSTDYIITRFISTHFDSSAVEYSKKVTKLTTLAAHRPLHPDTEQHKQFKISCQEQLKALIEEYPEKNFSDLFATFV